jgi:8-oxo-dGTP pyrophosphatase MutT (NUDIX family)
VHPLVTADDGARLLSLQDEDEQTLDSLVTGGVVEHALVVLQQSDAVLLVFHRLRNDWELPGGRIEGGETARTAAARELLEETGYVAATLSLRGVAHSTRPPDGRDDFAAVFTGTSGQVVASSAVPNEEVAAITWWGGSPLTGRLDPIDAVIARWAIRCSGGSRSPRRVLPRPAWPRGPKCGPAARPPR